MAGIKNDFVALMNEDIDAKMFVDEHQTVCVAGTGYVLVTSLIGTIVFIVGAVKIGKTVKGFLR